MCEKLKNLFLYRDLIPLFRKAEQEESYFLHVISIIEDAIDNYGSTEVLKFLSKWKYPFENFLTVSVPKRLIISAAENSDVGPYVITESFLSILEHLLEEPCEQWANFNETVFWALSYFEAVVNHRNQSLFNDSPLKNIVTKLKMMVSLRMPDAMLFEPHQCVESIRNLSVIPAAEDLLKETPDVRPRIKIGDYDSVEHYLDLNFRLIKEDMLYGLRKGLSEYKSRLKNKEKLNGDFECVRVYPSVKLKEALYEVNQKIYKFDVAMPQTVDFESTKRMKTGNLLCLTKSHFQTVIIVCIVKRHPVQGEGNSCTISVKIEADNDEDIQEDINMDDSYVVLEPESYFESYRHILSNMKVLHESNFPLGCYLVKPSSEHLENSVLSGFEENILQKFMQKESLNSSQKEAVKLALTNPVSLIQGPPGTGKTYVGLSIIKFLLDSSNQQSLQIRRPILIMCYTNHALDKFLEGILSFNTRVIRVGGRSDSEKLKPYVLSNVACAMSDFTKDRKRSRNDVEGSDAALYLKQSLNVALDLMPDGFPYSKQRILRAYVLGAVLRYINKKSILCDQQKIFHRDLLELMLNYRFKLDLMQKIGSSDIVSAVREWLHTETCDEEELKGELKVILSAMSDGTHYSGLVSRTETAQNATKSPWDLNLSMRKQKFCIFRGRFLKKIEAEIKLLQGILNVLRVHINKVKIKYDCDVLKNADVVGFTTTGAAKNRELLELLKPEIVLVEEASEVDELHIVASIPSSVKHLILIGDHEQLKPTPACHHLSSDYNLNLSLFERLHLAGNRAAPRTMLQEQRRMRPSICGLLVPLIYNRLDNHDVVKLYDDIRGVDTNTFFISHEEPEVERDVEKTHWNIHEAKFIAAFTYYLMNQQKYACSQITVLTMYSGQQKILKKLFELKGMSEVLVSTVDGFLGEENHIVVVSFVRSNDKDEIGFLESSNRVCVALSRAMGGLYCIGNFELYAKKKDLWHKLVEKLKENKEFGEKMPLRSEDGKIDYVSSALHFIKTCPNSSAECDFYRSLESFTLEDLMQN